MQGTVPASFHLVSVHRVANSVRLTRGTQEQMALTLGEAALHDTVTARNLHTGASKEYYNNVDRQNGTRAGIPPTCSLPSSHHCSEHTASGFFCNYFSRPCLGGPTA